MAAAAPRKRAPKAAAPKPEPAPSPHREAIAAFEELRDRAQRSGYTFAVDAVEPYVLNGGFEPPIQATWPRSLVEREQLDHALRTGNIYNTLRLLFGETDYARVLTEFDRYAEVHPEVSGAELLMGLRMKVVDHFVGPGASDVPGGTPAS